MGTTAEKLSYLNETKTKIKNALETPSNTFRDYPELIKKYVDNQPTKTATDGICDNAVELPIVSLKADGNSEQKTTEGKNKFNIESVTTSEISNWNINTINNKLSITHKNEYTTGTPKTDKYYFDIGKYIISFDGNNGISLYKNNSYITIINSGYELDVESKEDYYEFGFPADANTTVIWENIIIRPINTSSTYEVYTGGIPSPNPKFPSEIEVIDGCNRFDETEILKAEGWTKNSDGYYNGSFLKWNNAFDTKTSGFTIKGGFRVNTQYILLFKGYVSGETASFRIKYDDETFSNYLFSNTSEELHTIVSTAGKNVVGLYGTYTSGGGNTLYVKDVQFIEGTALKPYLPHGAIGLEQSGKNKFDNRVQSQLSNNAKETTLDENKRITLTQATYSYAVFKIKQNVSDYAGKVVRLKADFTKSNSNLNPKYGVLLGDANYSQGRQLMGESTVSGYTINFNLPSTFENGKEYLYVRLYATVDKEGNIDDYVDFNNIILTIDNEDMTYEPYHEPKTIPIDLNGNELAKVGDIKDKLIIHRNGDVEIEKRIGKINLKDVTLWYQDKELSNSNRFYTNEIIYANSKLTLSNYFKTSNIQNINTVDEQGVCAVNNRQIALRINKTLVTNVDELKQWLLEHDVEVYYQLINAEIIKLPSIATIQLWQGTNIFKLITNLETDFEVEYVVDKDGVLDEVQTAMLDAEIEI